MASHLALLAILAFLLLFLLLLAVLKKYSLASSIFERKHETKHKTVLGRFRTIHDFFCPRLLSEQTA